MDRQTHRAGGPPSALEKLSPAWNASQEGSIFKMYEQQHPSPDHPSSPPKVQGKDPDKPEIFVALIRAGADREAILKLLFAGKKPGKYFNKAVAKLEEGEKFVPRELQDWAASHELCQSKGAKKRRAEQQLPIVELQMPAEKPIPVNGHFIGVPLDPKRHGERAAISAVIFLYRKESFEREDAIRAVYGDESRPSQNKLIALLRQHSENPLRCFELHEGKLLFDEKAAGRSFPVA